MDLDLTDRVALVTGAGSGIGAACARELAGLGAAVVVADRFGETAEKVADDIGSEYGTPTLAVTADVTDVAAVDAVVRATVDRFGRLDVAVNNAGVGQRVKTPMADADPESWREVVGVNLDGVFLCLRAELGVIADGGSVVNVGSVMGTVSSPGAAAYVASKHGVDGLTKVAALDYAHRRVRVNTVAAGFIDTPLLGYDERTRSTVAAAHALGRLGTAEEVAAVVAFVASPAASFVTGTSITVDGGYLAR